MAVAQLRREFEQFGPIQSLRMVNDEDGKPRGCVRRCIYNRAPLRYPNDLAWCQVYLSSTGVRGVRKVRRVYYDHQRAKRVEPNGMRGGSRQTKSIFAAVALQVAVTVFRCSRSERTLSSAQVDRDLHAWLVPPTPEDMLYSIGRDREPSLGENDTEICVFFPAKPLTICFGTRTTYNRYAFVEYENEDDMRLAYKRGDGRKIDGRRVLVDVERGRTVRDWKVG